MAVWQLGYGIQHLSKSGWQVATSLPTALSLASVKPARLEQAFDLLLHDRTKCESFCDWVEIDEAKKRKTEIIQEVANILQGKVVYSGFTAQLYQLPKDDLVTRRLIYVPFKDALLRLVLVLEIADQLDAKMIDSSFANRRARGPAAQRIFLAPWTEYSLPMLYGWREEVLERWGSGITAIKSDLTAFYDMIGHEALIQDLEIAGALKVGGRDEQLLRLALAPQLNFRIPGEAADRNAPMTHGLCTGGAPDAFLSNCFFMDIDAEMAALRGIDYARYCDDVTIVGGNEADVRKAFRRYQTLVQKKCLAINSRKTDIRRGRADVAALLEARETSAERYEEVPDDYESANPKQGLDPVGMEFEEQFDPNDASAVKAKPAEFCKYLGFGRKNGKRLVPFEARSTVHLQRLLEIIERDIRPGKHAAWLVIETAAVESVSPVVRNAAKELILQLLESPGTRLLARLRLIHHLVARTKGGDRQSTSWCQSLFNPTAKLRLQAAAVNMLNSTDWTVRQGGKALQSRLAT